MNLSRQTQAILLLTVTFGKNDTELAKPLSKREWSRFAVWLKDKNLGPSDLLKGDVTTLLSNFIDNSISADRIVTLLERGPTLGLSLERWERAGLWVMTRSDPDYPERLKRKLGTDCPAVFFGCGNKSLLNKGGIAVIGSRDASEDDLKFTHQLGEETALQGYSMVSGGARGVDQTAMLGALDNDGTAIGVLGDSLLKSATLAMYRNKIMSGDLVLISPFNPEAGFNVGNAMARNRYIYCLSDAAIVISSTENKGGTWNGAIENLKGSWVPLWVKLSKNSSSGNSSLVNKGASWLPNAPIDFENLFISDSKQSETGGNLFVKKDLLAGLQPTSLQIETNLENESGNNSNLEDVKLKEQGVSGSGESYDLFSIFMIKFAALTKKSPLKTDEVAASLDIERSQANAWLKRGVSEGKIKKLNKPVRYQFNEYIETQASLF